MLRSKLSYASILCVGIGSLVAVGAADRNPAPERPEQPASASVVMRPTITLDLARQAAEAALAEAQRLNAGGAIAVVDDGGHLVTLIRIDGAFPAAAEVAEAKARTAAIFRRPTQDFENAVRNGRNTLLAVGPMTPLEGGVPIIVSGQIVGAVGVSGAHSSTEDVQIATAGAAVAGK